MQTPNLDGKNIKLVGLTLNFAEDMFEYSKVSDFYTYMEFGPHRSIDDTKNYLKKLLDRVNRGDSVYWAICLNKKEKMIGTFGIVDINKNSKSVQIGYGISPHYWNCGLFKESLSLVMDYCYNTLGLEKIEAITMAENIASIKGLLRLGFHQERYIEKFYSKHDGSHPDALILSSHKSYRLDGFKNNLKKSIPVETICKETST